MINKTSGKRPFEIPYIQKQRTTRYQRRRTEDFTCNPPSSLQSKELSPAEAAAQKFVNELSVNDSKALFEFRVARQTSNQWHISDVYSRGSPLNREYNAILSNKTTYTSQDLKSVDDDNQSPDNIIRQYIIKNPIDPNQFENERKIVINSYIDSSETTDFSQQSQVLLYNINTSQSKIFKILLQWQLLPTQNISAYMKKDFANRIIKGLNSKKKLPIDAIYAVMKSSSAGLTHAAALFSPLTITALEDSLFATVAHSHRE